MSLVSMRSLAWRARFVIHAERFLFDPGEVTPALFGRHRATDLEEMVEHVLLALDPGMRGFEQECLDLRRDLAALIEQRPDPGFVAGDALA